MFEKWDDRDGSINSNSAITLKYGPYQQGRPRILWEKYSIFQNFTVPNPWRSKPTDHEAVEHNVLEEREWAEHNFERRAFEVKSLAEGWYPKCLISFVI